MILEDALARLEDGAMWRQSPYEHRHPGMSVLSAIAQATISARGTSPSAEHEAVRLVDLVWDELGKPEAESEWHEVRQAFERTIEANTP